MSESIVITGIGICSAIGNNVKQFVESLRLARTGLKPYACDEAPELIARVAGTVADLQAEEHFAPYLIERWDRGTQLAACAAVEALDHSGIDLARVSPTRLALASGASGSGQFQPSRTNPMRHDRIDGHIARLLLNHNVPSFQTNELARAFGIHGPLATVSSASAGSGIAIGIGMRWLQSGQADFVLAGGGEGLLPLNIIGFDSLGILSPDRCAPFSRSEGMSMGEGAGFVVIERMSTALARNATILAELYGFSVTNDAFDAIQFDPSGSGIHQAMSNALTDARITPRDIDWVRASGAGGRSQDAAELAALQNTFGAHKPWVTSLESTVGHTNGAGPAMGLVACVACSQAQLLPATLNFDESLPNEPYDFVPNVPRTQSIRTFVSTTAAFGGTNVVLVGGAPRNGLSNIHREEDTISITGIGIVSPQGCGTREVALQLLDNECQWQLLPQTVIGSTGPRRLGQVKDFDARKLLSSLKLRGVDQLTQYAAGAVRFALQDSNLSLNGIQDRVGIVTGIARPSNETLEKLLQALEGPWASLNVSKHLLRKGRFLVASQLANWYRCKGFSATITDGMATTGLTALAVAAEQLRKSDQLDAVLVVSADQTTQTSLRLWDTQGCLACGDEEMLPYDESGQGMILGEGAVAFVLQRASQVQARGGQAIANILSVGSSFDAMPIAQSPQEDRWLEVDTSGQWLSAAIENALEGARLQPDEIGSIFGNGCGIPEYDQRELRAIRRVFGDDANVQSINPSTGVLEAACGLMAVAAESAALASSASRRTTSAAISGLSISDQSPNSLILASSEKGRNVAMVVTAG